jgi:hypothetical protein
MMIDVFCHQDHRSLHQVGSLKTLREVYVATDHLCLEAIPVTGGCRSSSPTNLDE